MSSPNATTVAAMQEARGERVYPPYSVMIKQLFKPMGTPVDELMHAAIGIAGEAAEYVMSDSRKNLIEESGDLEFYIEALKQKVEPNPAGALALPADHRFKNLTIGNVFQNISTIGGDILDISKKSWVYTKPVDTAKLTLLILVLEHNMSFIYECFGFTREEIKTANQVKLIGPGGRFESGFYSDNAAIARADKPQEHLVSDRKFIGSTQA